MNRDRKRLCRILLTMLVLTFISTAYSQNNTLSRQYVPVIVKGEWLPVQDFPIEKHYYAFKFDAKTNTWTSIPFQFNEMDEKGLFVLKGDSLYDGLVDSNDQLIFMPEHVGDRALTSDWIVDPGAQNNARIELELSESADPTQKGWVYLFKSLQNPPSLDNIAQYIAPPGISTTSDTIKTANYILGHNDKGWMDYAVIRGTDEKDLLDRIKLHLRGKLDLGGLGKFPYDLNETANLDSPRVQFQNGPVQALRKYTVNFVLPPLLEESFSYIMSYSPFSTFIGTQGINLSDSTIKQYLPILGIRSLRQSVDLSENARGMRFYNPGNSQGVTIDGIPDIVSSQINLSPDHTWMLATGSNGTLVSLVQVPPIGEQQALYYYDDAANLAIPDSTRDTGDSLSIGDMGVLFTIGDSLEGLVISIDLSFFFLPASDKPMEIGENLRRWVNQPLNVTANEQMKTPVSVADQSNYPAAFALQDAYPNPFNSRTGITKFRFTTGPERAQAILRIYNTLGQEVQRFERAPMQASASVMEFSWDGRDFSGKSVPAGIYIYRLDLGNRSATKKLMLIR